MDIKILYGIWPMKTGTKSGQQNGMTLRVRGDKNCHIRNQLFPYIFLSRLNSPLFIQQTWSKYLNLSCNDPSKTYPFDVPINRRPSALLPCWGMMVLTWPVASGNCKKTYLLTTWFFCICIKINKRWWNQQCNHGKPIRKYRK